MGGGGEFDCLRLGSKHGKYVNVSNYSLFQLPLSFPAPAS